MLPVIVLPAFTTAMKTSINRCPYTFITKLPVAVAYTTSYFGIHSFLTPRISRNAFPHSGHLDGIVNRIDLGIFFEQKSFAFKSLSRQRAEWDIEKI